MKMFRSLSQLKIVILRQKSHSAPMRRGEILGRRGGIGSRNLKQQLLFKGLLSWRLGIAVIVLLICIFSLYSLSGFASPSYTVQNIDVNTLWRSADSGGWRASSAPRTNWPPPPVETNGYLRVRCNGGLNQQRSAICNAVVAARIMNATLILPDLDTNSFWRDESGFPGIYDVEHFIKTLRFDVRIVKSIPDITSNGKLKKMKPHQIRPPRDAPLSWYTTFALEKMKKHGAIYLTPFSHRLAEDIDEPELQRLRCRVNYHALRFKPHIMKISSEIVNKLRQEGRFMSIHLRFEMDMLAFAGFKPHIMRISSEIVNKLRQEGRFMSIHLRFEMDMLAFAGCFDIFTPAEQKILKKYRNANFAPKDLVYRERRLIGKCPLTPEEVGLLLRSMGFSNSTRIYLASGALFGGDRFMSPFRSLFPLLSNHSSIAPSLLSDSDRGLAGSAVDYMVCLLSDIFIPTYDGPSNFANNLMGHRLYYGFRTTITPDRKSLAPVFMDREEGKVEEEGFEERVRRVMFASGKFGGVHERGKSESFYTNSWPECFCKVGAREKKDVCPSGNVVEGLERRWREEGEGEEERGSGSGREESVG